MPSVYAHYSFGSKVLDILPRETQKLINRHKNLYQIGLQGRTSCFIISLSGKTR